MLNTQVGRPSQEDIQNREEKEWTQMQEDCLWESREEWRRLCH